MVSFIVLFLLDCYLEVSIIADYLLINWCVDFLNSFIYFFSYSSNSQCFNFFLIFASIRLVTWYQWRHDAQQSGCFALSTLIKVFALSISQTIDENPKTFRSKQSTQSWLIKSLTLILMQIGIVAQYSYIVGYVVTIRHTNITRIVKYPIVSQKLLELHVTIWLMLLKAFYKLKKPQIRDLTAQYNFLNKTNPCFFRCDYINSQKICI